MDERKAMNIGKFKTTQTAMAMIRHYWKNWERTKHRENLDLSKNGENYTIGPDPIHESDIKKAVERQKELFGRRPRKDLNYLATIAITAPPEMLDTPAHREQLPQFFQICYETLATFLSNNGLSLDEAKLTGFVHMNESKPEMHCPCIPINKQHRISFDTVFTRKVYQDYHNVVAEQVKKELGRNVSILIADDDDTQRMLSRAGLDIETYMKVKDRIREDLKESNADLLQQKEYLRRDVATIEQSIKKEEKKNAPDMGKPSVSAQLEDRRIQNKTIAARTERYKVAGSSAEVAMLDLGLQPATQKMSEIAGRQAQILPKEVINEVGYTPPNRSFELSITYFKNKLDKIKAQFKGHFTNKKELDKSISFNERSQNERRVVRSVNR